MAAFRNCSVLAAMALVGCGAEDLGTAQLQIISGVPSEDPDFPETGALLWREGGDSPTEGDVVCSGVLVAADVILTAAHCLEDPSSGERKEGLYFFSSSKQIVGFDAPDFVPPPGSAGVSRLAVHPDWSPGIFSNSATIAIGGLGRFDDLAVGFLDRAFVDVPPGVVHRDDRHSWLREGAEVTIVGFGGTGVNPSNRRREHHAQSFINELGSFEFLVGGPTQPRQCYGDSGGATFMEIQDGLYPTRRIVGIASHQHGEPICDVGIAELRVDALYDWIEATMEDGCTQGLRVHCAEENGPARAGPANSSDLPEPQAEDSSGGCTCVAHPASQGGLLLPVLLIAVFQRRSSFSRRRSVRSPS